MNKFYLGVVILGIIAIGTIGYSLMQDWSDNIDSTSDDGLPIPSIEENPIPQPSEPFPDQQQQPQTTSQTVLDPKLQPHYCTPSSREIECDESQDVVCGWFSQQSGCTGPCVKLYVNPCQACIDDRVDYWTLGDCPIHG